MPPERANEMPYWPRVGPGSGTNLTQTRGEHSQYIETNGMERVQPYSQVRAVFVVIYVVRLLCGCLLKL